MGGFRAITTCLGSWWWRRCGSFFLQTETRTHQQSNQQQQEQQQRTQLSRDPPREPRALICSAMQQYHPRYTHTNFWTRSAKNPRTCWSGTERERDRGLTYSPSGSPFVDALLPQERSNLHLAAPLCNTKQAPLDRCQVVLYCYQTIRSLVVWSTQSRSRSAVSVVAAVS